MSEPEYTHELSFKVRICAPDDDTAYESLQKDVADILHDIAAFANPSMDYVITTPLFGEWDGTEHTQAPFKVKYAFRKVFPTHGYHQIKTREKAWQNNPASDKQIEYIKTLMSKQHNLQKAVEIECILREDGAFSITEGLTQGQAGYVIAVLTGKTFEDDWHFNVW